jgi:nitrogen fixation protein FixH
VDAKVMAMQHVKQMIRQRWIPSLFVLGFLVVVAVNTVLIVTATGSFSGLVVSHPYKKGTEYSRLHQALIEQKTLNWHYSLESSRQNDGQVRLILQWRDSAGLAIPDLDIEVEASRPVENVVPRKSELQSLGGGRYAGLLDLPREGLWDLRITARRDDREFVAAERIQVQ